MADKFKKKCLILSCDVILSKMSAEFNNLSTKFIAFIQHAVYKCCKVQDIAKFGDQNKSLYKNQLVHIFFFLRM